MLKTVRLTLFRGTKSLGRLNSKYKGKQEFIARSMVGRSVNGTLLGRNIKARGILAANSVGFLLKAGRGGKIPNMGDEDFGQISRVEDFPKLT